MTANDGQGGRTILGTGQHGAISDQPAAESAAAPAVSVPVGPDPLIGRALAGRYNIERKLGEGGMGAVYIGRHLTLDKLVAIKVLHPEYARKPDLVERFLQEAKSASRIRHENVIDITDFGVTDDGMVFFCMEYLTGQDLHELVTRAKLEGRRVPWERSAPIFLQICGALAAAHDAGVIHRDLKPENIFLIEWLGSKDFVKLLDFGIAKMTEVEEGQEDRKLTKTGMLFGTPEYMSPEQARGEAPDHRVDVYAMGCILFQLVTGDVPFAGESFMAVLAQHLTAEAPVVGAEALAAVGAPAGLSAVISKSLEKNRDQRYSSVTELADAVRAACGGDVVSADVEASRTRSGWRGSAVIPTAAAPAVGVADTVSLPPTAGSSKKGIVAALALVGVLAIGGIVYALTRGGDATENKTPEVTEGANPGKEALGAGATAPGQVGDQPATNDTPSNTLEPGTGETGTPGTTVDVNPVEEPTGDTPTSDKPAADKPVADTPGSDKPAAKLPADKPVSDKPASDKPVSDKPASDKPPVKKPPIKKPRDKTDDIKPGDVGTKSPFGDKKKTP